MESRRTTKMNSRRPPLKTCGDSFIKLADKAYEKAQNFNGRFSYIFKMLVWFFSIVSPFILLKFRIFATLSIIDYWIFALESVIETIYPPSGYAFDKFDELVGFVEILPGKLEEVIDRFPLIIRQVPFIYSIWLQVVSCLDFFLSESRFEPPIRSKSIEGDYVLIEWESKYKEDTLLESQKEDRMATKWGLRKETNTTRREFPSFKEDRKATKWGLRNEVNDRWESLSFKENRMAPTKWGSRNGANTRLESPSFKEERMATKWGSRNEANTKWGSRNEANTRQDQSSRFKADCKATEWGSRDEKNSRQESQEDHNIATRNESVTCQESQLVKQDSLSRKRVSESEPAHHHQESRNHPEEDHNKFTNNWESRKKQDTRQEPQSINEKDDQVLPQTSLPEGRSYKDVLAKEPADRKVEKGTATKGEKGSGGKGERRRRKKRWNQLKW